jgi:phage shock protein A
MVKRLIEAALDGHAPSPESVDEYLRERRAQIAQTTTAAQTIVARTRLPAERYNEVQRSAASRRKKKGSATTT